jgi:hypothetical protein
MIETETDTQALEGTTQEEYIMIAGSSCRELIATLFPESLESLEEAIKPRAQLSRDLNAKLSIQAEAEHRKKLVHGELPPEKWQPVEQLREYYRKARTNGRRKVVDSILTREKPIVLEAFDKLAKHLVGIREEVESLEEGFYREFGVEHTPVLPRQIRSKETAIARAKEDMSRGSYFDCMRVLREFFGPTFAEAVGVPDEAEETESPATE